MEYEFRKSFDDKLMDMVRDNPKLAGWLADDVGGTTRMLCNDILQLMCCGAEGYNTVKVTIKAIRKDKSKE